jgi:hypothetical protein
MPFVKELRVLGLCESTAGRHIAAARVCRNHPEVFAMVASGALHASALSLLRKHLTTENAAELFELCKQRSARKVEELLATRFPRPDVRDLVRRLPTPPGLTLDVGCASEKVPAEISPPEPAVELTKTKATESRPREPLAAPAPPKPGRLEPLSADRFGVHFTADGEFLELLERVRGLAGHRLPSGDLMTLLKLGLEAYERELSKQRFALGRKQRGSRGVAPAPSTPEPAKLAPDPESNASSTLKRRRRYPADVARAVFLRDGKQCSYVSPDGRRCNARRCLELDHIDPYAVGGQCTIENLRLRCRAHNQRHAQQYFGKSRVEAALRHSRLRRAAAERPE